ncbi:unnamed protein product [Meloidogyne enterolobii]|uniref:Uncharacterized protein n=1 Tax=Meloidogyne enterolobii TaxID=390850 RepID=A0ACB0YWG0_MELEN
MNSPNLQRTRERRSKIIFKRLRKKRRKEGKEFNKKLIKNKRIFSTKIFLILFSTILLNEFILNNVEAIRCYCTDEHCVPYGVCESNVCLVGLLRANNAVIRTCGSQSLGCQRNVDRWSHLCSCDENFCNTFLFLKANTNIDGPRNRLSLENPSNKQSDSSDQRIFERVDQPSSGEFATFDHQLDNEPMPIKNSNLLTLLLVIVPLSVGAAAVVVVAINYYCHLC